MDRNISVIRTPIGCVVALRKESVDRNNDILRYLFNGRLSLSARRAWIEIQYFWKKGQANNVALRKESVDRNRVAK